MQHQDYRTHGKAFVRTIRTTAITALSTGVLVCAAVGVAAQDGAGQLPAIFMWTSPDGQTAGATNGVATADPLSSVSSAAAGGSPDSATDAPFETPVYFTWQNGEWTDVDEGTFDESTGTLTGLSGRAIPIMASDPRFDSSAWVTVNGQRQENGDDVAIIESRAYRTVDTFGCAWTGFSTHVLFGTRPEPPTYDSEAVALTGDGPCEGMTMWATGDYLEDPYGEAVIIAEPVPPTPDVPDAELAVAG
jgi:hypothetical protein